MDRNQLRIIILHEYKCGHSGTKTAEIINEAWGEGTITRQTVNNWFRKFRKGDMGLEDKEGRGRPSVVDIAKLKRVMLANPHQSSKQYANKLKVGKSSILRALEKINKDKGQK